MKLQLIGLSIGLGSALGCSSSIGESPVRGEPLGGDVTGSYGSTGFSPKYGVAIASSAPEQAELELQLGEAALNCDRYLASGALNPFGLFARIYLKTAQPGAYPNSFVEFDQLTDSHTTQLGAPSGNLTVSAIDATHLEGSIVFQETVSDVAVALNGSFQITRCQ